MMKKLTQKQEIFAQKYVEIGNQSEAYRQSYNAENMKNETILVKACNLLKQDKIRVRVEELKTDHVERHGVTIDKIVEELEKDKEFARECKSASTVVKTTELKAKLYGLFVDKIEHSGALEIDTYVKEVESDADDIIRSL